MVQDLDVPLSLQPLCVYSLNKIENRVYPDYFPYLVFLFEQITHLHFELTRSWENKKLITTKLTATNTWDIRKIEKSYKHLGYKYK